MSLRIKGNCMSIFIHTKYLLTAVYLIYVFRIQNHRQGKALFMVHPIKREAIQNKDVSVPIWQ